MMLPAAPVAIILSGTALVKRNAPVSTATFVRPPLIEQVRLRVQEPLRGAGRLLFVDRVHDLW
jgi:hypothetical protein